MKVCPICETENEDRYIYCGGCHKPLPKESHMDNLMTLGLHEFKKKNYRKAVNYFDKILKLNIGDKKAWFLKGIALSALGAGGEARECYSSSGVKIREKTCHICLGAGKCMSCNQTGICYMCKGRRKCPMCGGSGICHRCDGDGCSQCYKTDGKCIRCKGSGECIYCDDTGVCPDCKGIKKCHKCGGTGRAVEINLNSVPTELRPYLKYKK
jgi:hypothetical protein